MKGQAMDGNLVSGAWKRGIDRTVRAIDILECEIQKERDEIDLLKSNQDWHGMTASALRDSLEMSYFRVEVLMGELKRLLARAGSKL
ncbi:MAG: hypothetical protein ACTSUE_23770 [Promethearchaeota archaeon]